MFRNLFAAEWLKLRRWPVAWALLGAFLVLMLLALALWALVLALHAGLIGRSRLTALNAAQLTQIERQLSFPGILAQYSGTSTAQAGCSPSSSPLVHSAVTTVGVPCVPFWCGHRRVAPTCSPNSRPC